MAPRYLAIVLRSAAITVAQAMVHGSLAIAKRPCLLTCVAHRLDRLGSPRLFFCDCVCYNWNSAGAMTYAPYAEVPGSQDDHTRK